MRRITLFFVIILGILLIPVQAYAEKGIALIKGTELDSDIIGKVKFEDTADGLKIRAKVKNASPGKHGFHIHEFGDCSENGKGAGDHFNPDKVEHGLLVKDGHTHAHAGDLGNIRVGPDGVGRFNTVVPGLSLSGGKYSVAGRGMILHQKVDDFGQPLGNAGPREGCGKILITKE